MSRLGRGPLADPPPDPFGEHRPPVLRETMSLLGGCFRFETDSKELLRIVKAAYAGLPSHRFSGRVPRFQVRLALAAAPGLPFARVADEPPPVSALAVDGVLCGAMGSASFVALAPQQRSGLIVVSRGMLRFGYHLRYELLEFAVYVLATRAQGLVPLHCACIGREGRGILLLGASGSGKSTLSLHCLLRGLDFLAEDSVLVEPERLLATGVANFLHVRRDSLEFLTQSDRSLLERRSSLIRRRSGVEKLEVDLRHWSSQLAPAPLRIVTAVCVSPERARGRTLLQPLSRAALSRKLSAGQQYAAAQPGWSAFLRKVSQLPAFELLRGEHPSQAVEALRECLSSRLSSAGRREPR